jgi:lipopolysaccharide exporter
LNWSGTFYNLSHSGFFRSVVTLLGGNILSQLVEIGAAPITTRLFTPENFGILALFGSIVGIFSKVGSLCYDRAVLMPKHIKDAANIMAFALAILVCTVIIIFGVLFILRPPILKFLKISDFETWLLLVPAGILLSGLVQLLKYWRIREKAFKAVATSRLTQSICSTLVKIAVGYFIGSVTGGLIGGVLIGTIVAFVTLVLKPRPLDLTELKAQLSISNMKSMAIEYKKFPMFASWNALFNVGSQHLIVFVFSVFFPPAAIGLYSLGNRVLGQPVIFLSDSVKNAFFQNASTKVANNLPVFRDFLKLTVFLFLIGIIPFGAIAFFGKSLFQFVFGENWSSAGTYMEIMAPWVLLIFSASPAYVVYDVLQIQDYRLVFNLSSALLRAITVIMGTWFFKDPVVTIAIFAAVNVLFELITIGFAFVMTYKHDNAPSSMKNMGSC